METEKPARKRKSRANPEIADNETASINTSMPTPTPTPDATVVLQGNSVLLYGALRDHPTNAEGWRAVSYTADAAVITFDNALQARAFAESLTGE